MIAALYVIALAGTASAAPQCSEYARLGYCTKASTRKYMERHCASSCQAGGGGAAGGSDEDEQCVKWAAEGYCEHEQYKAFMTRSCPNSCGLDPQAAPADLRTNGGPKEALALYENPIMLK